MNEKNQNTFTKKDTLTIEGMHCAGCVQTVAKSLQSTKGVRSASVNLSTEKALVEYDPTVVNRDQLVAAVKNVGYDVKQVSKKVALKIGGMHCAACVGNVEKALIDSKGVLEVKVNLPAEKAIVIFDPTLSNLAAFKTAVQNSGYEYLGETGVASTAADSERNLKKVQKAKKRMAVSWAFTTPIIALAVLTLIAGLLFPDILKTVPQRAHAFLHWLNPELSTLTLAILLKNVNIKWLV